VAEAHDVVPDAGGLVGGVEATDEPLLLRGDTGGAMAGVALLRLDAADGEHRFAGHGDAVGAERKGHHCLGGQTETAGADEGDLLVESGPGERAVDLGEALPERQCDVVGEWQRCGAGAALAAVDGDEIRAPAGACHLGRQLVPELHLPHGGLDADRETGRIGDAFDGVDQALHVIERTMARGRVDGDADLDAAGGGDLGGDLAARQYATETGLRPLAELQLDRLDLGALHRLEHPIDAECAVGVAGPEVAGAELEDERAAVAVMGADAALTGVVRTVGQRRAPVHRLDRSAGQRAEAHGRDVHDGGGCVGVRPTAPLAHDLAHGEIVGMLGLGVRERVVAQEHVAGLGDVVVGTEPEVRVLLLRRGVDEATFVSREGPFLVVVGDDVLPQLGSGLLEQVAEVADDREVAEDRMLLLGHVVNEEADEEDTDDNEDPQPP